MCPFPLITTLSDVTAVGAASTTNSTLVMLSNHLYLYMADCATFIKQGATPTASAADGSAMISANTPVLLDGSEGAKIAVMHPTATGQASLTPVKS